VKAREFRTSTQEIRVTLSIFAKNPHFHDCMLASPSTAGL
jgi:hypothetical protein